MKRFAILVLGVVGLSFVTAMVAVAAEAPTRPSESNLSVAKSSQRPAQLIEFELWIIRLHDAADPKDADELERLSTRPAILPMVLGDRDEVRSFIDRMQARKTLQSTAEYRLAALDGHKAFLLDTAQLPRVTGVSISDFGRTNNIMYQQIGTNIVLAPRVEQDRTITVGIDVEKSWLEESDDVAITEPKDGHADYAVTIPTLTLKSNVRLESGSAEIIAQMKDSAKHATVLLVLSATVIEPKLAAKDE